MPSFIATDEAAREAFTLDERAAGFVAMPDSEAACAQIVRWAAEQGSALVPWGGGTAIQQGNRFYVSRWGALCTTKMSALVEYSPDDMVVTAQGGMTLAALQTILSERKQFLPIDAPAPERATLGGIVATNTQGLWRPAFGAPRDRLLGVRVVLADGSVVKGGGKVVKNVAGYDLCKLFAGSWGTLGIISEVTFKTSPLPEARAHLVFAVESMQAGAQAALQVHTQRLQPTYLTLASTPSPALYVGLQGNAKTVAWQGAEIARLLETAGLKRAEGGLSEEALRGLLSVNPSYALTARMTVRVADLPALIDRIAPLTDALACHIPTGIVEIGIGGPAANGTEAEMHGRITRLKQAVPTGGSLVWTRLPTAWKTELDVWGPTRPDFRLMRGIKEALDPQRLFSPGRFVGRL